MEEDEEKTDDHADHHGSTIIENHRKERTGMNKIVRMIVTFCARILVLVILFAFAVVAGRSAYETGYRIYTEPAMSTTAQAKEISIEIPGGMNERDVAELMEEYGLCRSQKIFYLQILLSEYKGKIKPGVYTLSTDMVPRDIIATLSGKNLEEEKGEE